MTRSGWLRLRLRRSVRVRLGAFLLVMVVLPAVFADLLASAAPLVARGPDGLTLLPGIMMPERFAGEPPQAITARYDWAIWAPVRYGPETPSGESAHPLGTDAAGRDVAARLVHGARVALGLAALAVALAVAFGVVLGALAGFLGGFWDDMLSRPIELVEAIPTVVVVAVARAVAPEAGALALVVAIAAVRWAEVARLVRSEVVRAGAEDFVVAARAIGCGPWRIVRRHILPRAGRPVVVSAMFGLVSVVILEAALSFLGLGVEGSWGVMIAEGLEPTMPLAVPVAATTALFVTVLASYLLADAVAEALDARVATTSRGL
jgi:peptide/nickel transport system permease protein